MGPSAEALALARYLLRDRSQEEASRLEVELAYELTLSGQRWILKFLGLSTAEKPA